MRLLANRVLIAPLPPPTQSAGGILLPEISHGAQTYFKVLAVGPGKRNKAGAIVPPEVKEGDRVVAPLYADHVLLPDDTRIIDAGQIIAVLSHES